MKHPYVISSDATNPYSPANHTGTVNRRVISRDTAGARHMEVLIGTIEKGHGAQRHLHPQLEQASFLLQGEGVVELEGEEQTAQPGYWMFTPEGGAHRFTVTSDTPAKVLVVYAPPYAENPDAAVHCEDSPVPERRVPHAQTPPSAAASAARPYAPENSSGVLFTAALEGAQARPKYMAIFDARFQPGAEMFSDARAGMEKVIFLRSGALSGKIADRDFEASEGDWIFIPDGALHEYKASEEIGAEAFVIHAFSNNH